MSATKLATRLLLLTIVWVISTAPSPQIAFAQEPQLVGDVPFSGVALVTFQGGTVDQLSSAARDEGCILVSFWLTRGGSLIGYIPGAPDFVNREMLDELPGGVVPTGETLLISCTPAPGGPVGDSTIVAGTFPEGLDFGAPLAVSDAQASFLAARDRQSMTATEVPGCVGPYVDDAQVALSPDTSLVACAVLGGILVTGGSIAPVRVDTGWVRSRFVWSPNSRFLAFVTTCAEPGDFDCARVEIVDVTHPDSAHFADIAARNGPYGSYQLTWSADSQLLAYTCADGQAGVCVADATGAVHFELDDAVGSPAWSPVEDLLAYECISGTCMASAAQAAGDELYGIAGRPTWSPNGDELVVAAWRDYWYESCSDLVVIAKGGAERARLTNEDECGRSPAWSPDATQVAIVVEGDTPRVEVVSHDGSTRVTLAAGPAAFRPLWSPDATLVSFTQFSGDLIGADLVNRVSSADGQYSFEFEGFEVVGWAPGNTVAVTPAKPPGAVALPNGFVERLSYTGDGCQIDGVCIAFADDYTWLVPESPSWAGALGEWNGHTVSAYHGSWNDYEHIARTDFVRVTPTGCSALFAGIPALGTPPPDTVTVVAPGESREYSGQALCDRAPVPDGIWVYAYARLSPGRWELRATTQVQDGQWSINVPTSGATALMFDFVSETSTVAALDSTAIGSLETTVHLTPEDDTLDWQAENSLTSPAAIAAARQRLWGMRVKAPPGDVLQLDEGFFQEWRNVDQTSATRIGLRLAHVGDVAYVEVWDRPSGEPLSAWSLLENSFGVSLNSYAPTDLRLEWRFLGVLAHLDLTLQPDGSLRMDELGDFYDPSRTDYTRVRFFEPGSVSTGAP